MPREVLGELKQPVRVVLDTNVFVSAAIKPRGASAEVLFLAADGKFDLVVSPLILSELEVVLSRPKIGFSEDKIRETVSAIMAIAKMVHPRIRLSAVKKDEADNRILECAVEAKADILVTGDLKHIRPLNFFEGIEILTPREFMDQYFP